eukprot:350766-Chlamydomonas_euryale.AAC.6
MPMGTAGRSTCPWAQLDARHAYGHSWTQRCQAQQQRTTQHPANPTSTPSPPGTAHEPTCCTSLLSGNSRDKPYLHPLSAWHCT